MESQEDSAISVGTDTVQTVYGYPEAIYTGSLEHVVDGIGASGDDTDFEVIKEDDSGWITFGIPNYTKTVCNTTTQLMSLRLQLLKLSKMVQLIYVLQVTVNVI